MSLETGPFWWLTIKSKPPTAKEKTIQFFCGCGCLLVAAFLPTAFVVGMFYLGYWAGLAAH